MNNIKILDEITAFGHKNILCTHKSTIEITKAKDLTVRGNCVLGVNASKSCFDLNPNLKTNILKANKIRVTIKLGNIKDYFSGFGSPKLKLRNRNDIVFRKSNYICGRTVLIHCTKSSNDLNRILIKKLRNPERSFSIRFELAELNS